MCVFVQPEYNWTVPGKVLCNVLHQSQLIWEHDDDDVDDDVIILINVDILGGFYILYCSLPNSLDFVKPFTRDPYEYHI